MESTSSSEDSIREVAVVFVLFDGMDKMKEAEHVGQVDGIFRSIQRSIYTYGGILRQFVVDDKGAVAVIAVGFPYFNYSGSEQPSRAVGIALDIRQCKWHFDSLSVDQKFLTNVGFCFLLFYYFVLNALLF